VRANSPHPTIHRPNFIILAYLSLNAPLSTGSAERTEVSGDELLSETSHLAIGLAKDQGVNGMKRVYTFRASPANLVLPLNYDGFHHKILFLMRFSQCYSPLIEFNRNNGRHYP
jgi:hypothetical protein